MRFFLDIMAIMPSKVAHSFSLRKPLTYAFLIPILYWAYLGFTAQMEVKFDSLGYEHLGRVIYQQGWVEFFKLFPEQSLLYPFVISIAMRAADTLSISYYPVLTVFQILILFLSQILLYRLLKKLDINEKILAVIIFYFGISPAMVNSAFSLYCEILTYPFVLGIILASAESWKLIQENSCGKIFFSAVKIALLFLLITCVRSIYNYIFVIFVAVYFGMSLVFLVKKQKRYFMNAALLLFVAFVLFHRLLMPYKEMNLKYNGHKVLTMVGATNVYANAAGRVRDLTTTGFLSAVAMVPGQHVCEKFFGHKAFDFWWSEQNDLGQRKMEELLHQGVPKDKIDGALVQLSREKVFTKPFQYAFLTALEGMKMFFWESTTIGFVTYPAWLWEVFHFTPFKNSLRFFIFVLTFIAYFYVLKHLWRNKLKIYNPCEPAGYHASILFFSVAVITTHVLLYSFFTTATRYTFPIVPLYLTLMAYYLSNRFCTR